MGLFDKMFGKQATAVLAKPDSQQQFNTLKQRFAPVLAAVEQQKVQLRNLHVQDDKLYLKGVAPSEEAKNKVWDQIKRISPDGVGIMADISVNPALAGPAPAPAAEAKTYTVKSGDTLSKIAKASYGDANEYMRIFYANQDKLKDPDKIQVGQVLRIPPDTDD
jgi:nucleoid-associated protein YgaU